MQRMLLEERRDPLFQVFELCDAVGHPVAMIRTHHSAAKKLLECMEQLDVPLMLNDREFGEHLKPCSHFRVLVHTDEEAPFSIDETHHPVGFKLIRGQDRTCSL